MTAQETVERAAGALKVFPLPSAVLFPHTVIPLRKLEAFEALVKRGDMGKAAVVAQDIDACVQSFDPRVYLPKLFMPYFRLLSANIGSIAPHWHETDSAAWRALEQLYRVDLDAFLEA